MRNKKDKPKRSDESLAKSGVKLSFFTLGSRILGLIRESVKAAYLGTTPLADAFSIAFMIPNLLRRLFAENSMTAAFIPTFKEYLEKYSKEETKEFLSATFTILSFLVTAAAVAGIAAAPIIAPFFGTAQEETVLLTRIMFPYLICISIAAFFQGILNGVKIFSLSGFTPILFNLCVIIGTIVLSPHTANPARAMAIGVVSGGVVQALFQLPFVLRQGFRFAFVGLKRAFANPGAKTVLRLIGPTIIGMAAYQLNDVVSSALAGHAGTGVVSSLQYSLRIQELILGIFAVSVGTVILPDLTGFAAREQWESFSLMLSRAMNVIALITIPATFFLLVCGEHVIKLLFFGKQFNAESVSLTLSAFSMHIIGLYFIALNRIIAPSFYAQKDSRSPVIAGIISFAANIILALILSVFMSGAGIALALSVSSVVNTLALFLLLRKKRKIDVIPLIREVTLYALRAALFSAVSVIPVVFLRPRIAAAAENCNRFAAQGAPLCVCFLAFMLIFIFLSLLARDKILSGLIRRFLKRKK